MSNKLEIDKVINLIYMHIIKSTIKSTKKLLINDLSGELLEAPIILKSKCKQKGSQLIKKTVENVLPEYKK